MDETRKLQTEVRKLRGNEALALDDPASIWQVVAGSLALFGVALRDGALAGPRNHFFTVEAGEIVAGLPATGASAPRLIAVALEETTLRRMHLDEIVAGASDGHADALDRWVARWNRCLGETEFRREPGDPVRSVREFHEALAARIRDVGENAARSDRARLQERDHRAREVAEEAFGKLTSILAPDEGSLATGSDPFVAVHAVGLALGLRLRKPAPWDEAKQDADPVEIIARANHLRLRRVLLQDAWWQRDCGPLLAFTAGDRRPVSLVPESSGSYRALDPSTRTWRAVDGAFASTLDPEAWVFYRPLPEQATNGLELLRFALRGGGKDLAVIFATACGATLLGMLTPQATALLIDRAIPNSNDAMLWQLGLGLAAAAFGSAVFRFAQGVAMMRVETTADVTAQSAVWDRLLNLQLSFFRLFSTGDLQSRVTAISEIRAYLGGTTMRTLFSGVAALLNLALLIYYSPMMTLLAVVAAAISAVATIASGTLIIRCARQIMELKGRFFGLMVQLFNGISKLRVAAAEERAFGRWAGEFARLVRLQLRMSRIQDTVHVINVGVSTLGVIALFALAASLIAAAAEGQGLTTGVFLAFSVAYGTFIGAVVSLSNTVTDVMAIAILRERVRPILEALPEVSERKADPGPLRGGLTVDHLVFRYQDDGPTILDDVNVEVGPGQFVALVGPSGSGKSTLLRLLLGFETPRSGSIFYDGQDLSGLDVHAVRRQMGVVLQSGRINAGSIFDNIASGAHVSLNDAWEAARATGFADEIAEMPMGLHTVISEGGTNLSGGQRQRLLLARALVHKPKVLLLDEATSALDNTTQAVVSSSLQSLEVTRIVIAHRLSTVRNADRIYVVQSGRIVQQGTFDELAGQPGLFARLMARQMT